MLLVPSGHLIYKHPDAFFLNNTHALFKNAILQRHFVSGNFFKVKALHVIPSLAKSQGGPSFAILAIARSLASRGVSVDIIATAAGIQEEDELRATAADLKPLGIRVFPFRRQTSFYKYSSFLSNWVKAHVSEYDIVHVHALFSHAPTSSALHARRQAVPYVVRPLGVLNQWGMKERRPLFKALSYKYRESKILANAAAVHFTSRQEQLEAESLGTPLRSVVIPLGIDLSQLKTRIDSSVFLERFPETRGRKIILFLSRIDPKKGLELLIRSFAVSVRRFPATCLVIAGHGDSLYVSSLRELVSRLGIENSVVWTGFVDGDQKRSALSAASIYALPSHSENFGIAAVEAMATGLPCVLTPGVAISEGLQESRAALVPDSSVDSISAAFDVLLSTPDLALEIGNNGRSHAFREFEMNTMGERLKALYQSLLERE